MKKISFRYARRDDTKINHAAKKGGWRREISLNRIHAFVFVSSTMCAAHIRRSTPIDDGRCSFDPCAR